MNRTKIEWVKNPDGSQGYTWNPLTGCLNNCPYCYARKLANGRLKNVYKANRNIAPVYSAQGQEYHQVDDFIADTDPFWPRFWPERLKEIKPKFTNPYYGKRYPRKPRGVFVCDMFDLFGIGVPDDWTTEILNVIKTQPAYRFYLLTKQPQNLSRFSPFPDNCWVGVSVTNQEQYGVAYHYLKDIKAPIKFYSFEPLLGNIDLTSVGLLMRVDWLIIGSQTKPYNPPKFEWVTKIVDAAAKVRIPIFLKNNLLPMFQAQWVKAYVREIWEDVDLRQQMPILEKSG